MSTQPIGEGHASSVPARGWSPLLALKDGKAVVIDPGNGSLSAGAAPGFDSYAIGW